MGLIVADLVKAAAEALGKAGIENAGREARALVALATRRRADRLSLEMREDAGSADEQALADILAARLRRVPLSHILGRRAFFEHEFHVTPDTLDPRPETEVLVREALAGSVRRVLDMGTGTGAIAISILAARTTAQGVASDVSTAALAVAEKNATRIGVSDRLALIESDWFGAVQGRFDLIVSNPPYVALDEMEALAPELAFEPRIALTDEGDGLAAYRAIAAGAGDHLTAGGRLLVEIGWQQGAAVSALFEAAGLADVRVLRDLDGRDRVVAAQKTQD
ncbi:peptide chain release factor N(5)-glutamine methyltransferase [Shimia abyssi]|uniref:Release factor glutamine methyltransferase n=1 Tax=Shimia abyssi TaxID=1662395 RepID=A0A2P8FGA8_9RHOB|nr:peptide chain release factor N(5)-glutamine methyltransferase [Shimia abyssi]PSL20741.1 [protein release factor]-glutamine N5-methyltransferase [Shimia abyssi]